MKFKKLVSSTLTLTLMLGIGLTLDSGQNTIKAYDANGTQVLMKEESFGGLFGDVKRDVTMFGDSGCNTYLVNTTVNPVEAKDKVQGIDFLFLVDTSGSMRGLDGTGETRSKRVRDGINAFIDSSVESNEDKTKPDIRVALSSYDGIYYNNVIQEDGTNPLGGPGRTEGYYYDKAYLKSVTRTQEPTGSTDLGKGLEGATKVIEKLNDSYYKATGATSYPKFGQEITEGREEKRIKVLIIFTDGDMTQGASGTYAENMRKELARGTQNNYDNIFICNSDPKLRLKPEDSGYDATYVPKVNGFAAKITGSNTINPVGGVSNAVITPAMIGNRLDSTGIPPTEEITSKASFMRNYFDVSGPSSDKFIQSTVPEKASTVGYENLKDAFNAIAEEVKSTISTTEPVSLVEQLSPFFSPYGGTSAYLVRNGNGQKIPIPTQTRYDAATHSMITDLTISGITPQIDTKSDKIVVEYKIKANSSLVSGGGINLFSATFFNTKLTGPDNTDPINSSTDPMYAEFADKYQYPAFEQDSNGNWNPAQNSNTFMVVPDPMKVTMSTDKVTVDNYGEEIKLSEAYGLVDANGNITGIQGGEGQYVVEWKYWDKTSNSYISIPGGIDAKFTVTEKTNFFVQVNCRIGCEFTSAVAVARINSNIIVNHYEEGTTNVLAPQETINTQIGEVYTTKPSVIRGYEVVTPIPENATGNAAETDIVVNYYYKAKEIKAIIKYLDFDTGEELKPEVVDNAKFGTEYNHLPLDIEGYTYVSVAGNASGTYEQDITITFYYQKTLPNQYNLRVRYVDTDGNVIASESNSKHEAGYSYSIDAIEIPGYEYDSFTLVDGLVRSNKALQNGVVLGTLDKDITITLIYSRNIEVNGVIVRHVDEYGLDLVPSTTIKGYIGNEYTTNSVTIDEYILKTVPQNANGVITETVKEVVYVYEKASGIVNVKYVDINNGNVLESFALTGKIGTIYETVQKNFAGYKFVSLSGSSIGQFKTLPQEVIYSYEAVKTGIVTILGVDESGNVLARGEKGVELGEIYTTEPFVIDGYTLINIPNNFIGIFDGEETVTYVYRKNEQTSGKLIITAIDESGKILYTDEKDLPVGYDYIITPQNLPGYTYVSSDKDLNGRIIPGETRVTLKYKVKTVTIDKNTSNNNNSNNNVKNTNSTNNMKKLPQTGGILNITLLVVIGMLLIITGVALKRKPN